MNSTKLIALVVAVIVVLVFLNAGSPHQSDVNFTPIDSDAGFTKNAPVKEARVIAANDGVLEGLILMVEFECSGVVYKKKKDRQDGFEYNVTLVFGRLAELEFFSYLKENGSMPKEFDGGFVLDTSYFQSHIAAFYVRSASTNIQKAIRSLKEGDHVRLKGYFVNLRTKNGIVTTSLNPAEYKCKYVYLDQVDTSESIYY